MIKNILFDLGGVFVPLNREKCLDSFRKIGVSEFETILSEYHQGGYFLEYEKGMISSAEFRDTIRRGVSARLTDMEIDAALTSFLEDIPLYKIELLHSLRSKGYAIYLLSNSNEICIKKVQKDFASHGIDFNTFFDIKFLSYEMKMVKPDKEIFYKVLKNSGIAADETLFVDDYRPNTESAAEIGFKTLLYDVKDNLTEKVEAILGEHTP